MQSAPAAGAAGFAGEQQASSAAADPVQWLLALPTLGLPPLLVAFLALWCGLTWRLADVCSSPLYQVCARQPCASDVLTIAGEIGR